MEETSKGLIPGGGELWQSLPFLSQDRSTKKGKGDPRVTGMDMCVVYGRIGEFRCDLYIVLSLSLVS